MPETTAQETLERWSFYTALLDLSNNSAHAARELPRLKSFDRSSVRNAGGWPAMTEECGCEGMASTTDRSADSAEDGF